MLFYKHVYLKWVPCSHQPGLSLSLYIYIYISHMHYKTSHQISATKYQLPDRPDLWNLSRPAALRAVHVASVCVEVPRIAPTTWAIKCQRRVQSRNGIGRRRGRRLTALIAAARRARAGRGPGSRHCLSSHGRKQCASCTPRAGYFIPRARWHEGLAHFQSCFWEYIYICLRYRGLCDLVAAGRLLC